MNFFRSLRLKGAGLPWQFAAFSGLWKGAGAPVQFVIENADWAIRRVGEHVRDEVNNLAPNSVEVTTSPARIANRIVHFGSQYMWLDWMRHMPTGNRYVTSFFHGKVEDGPDVAAHIERFLETVPKLSTIVTGAGLIERRLLSWGVPREKVVRIPIGVDTRIFRAPTEELRALARKRFELTPGRVIVGSFQKDGTGWGNGLEPKHIKGPDIFVAAMAELKAQGVPVTAFLTGPARGYVMQALKQLDIPFVHTFIKNHAELATCYHALDLYLVTSREEGGPMGLLESMASGVPVVSTYVGMAPDLITDGVSGGLINTESPLDIALRALDLLAQSDGGQSLRAEARKAVLGCDWTTVGRDHWLRVYRPLMT
jgi:glycosyltransferase involved in cell wall biosynthesis